MTDRPGRLDALLRERAQRDVGVPVVPTAARVPVGAGV